MFSTSWPYEIYHLASLSSIALEKTLNFWFYWNVSRVTVVSQLWHWWELCGLRCQISSQWETWGRSSIFFCDIINSFSIPNLMHHIEESIRPINKLYIGPVLTAANIVPSQPHLALLIYFQYDHLTFRRSILWLNTFRSNLPPDNANKQDSLFNVWSQHQRQITGAVVPHNSRNTIWWNRRKKYISPIWNQFVSKPVAKGMASVNPLQLFKLKPNPTTKRSPVLLIPDAVISDSCGDEWMDENVRTDVNGHGITEPVLQTTPMWV